MKQVNNIPCILKPYLYDNSYRKTYNTQYKDVAATLLQRIQFIFSVLQKLALIIGYLLLNERLCY